MFWLKFYRGDWRSVAIAGPYNDVQLVSGEDTVAYVMACDLAPDGVMVNVVGPTQDRVRRTEDGHLVFVNGSLYVTPRDFKVGDPVDRYKCFYVESNRFSGLEWDEVRVLTERPVLPQAEEFVQFDWDTHHFRVPDDWNDPSQHGDLPF